MIHLGKRTWRPYAAVTAAVLSLAVVLAAPGSAGAANKAAAAPRAAAVSPSASLIAPGNELRMTSAIRGLTSTGQAVTGRFIPRSFFINRHGHLVAHGILNLVVQRATPLRTSTTANVPVQTVKSIPTTSALSTRSLAAAALPAGACNILNLVLGPLHLNLLGLVIDLNRVVLNIIGQTGAGNLLGNLLCAVAGLLDGNPLGQQLGQVAALLNSLLAILQ
jgi:hypothetical protein